MRAVICLAVAAFLGCTTPAIPAPMTRSQPMDDETTPKVQLDVKGTGAPLVLVGGGLTGWLSPSRAAATRA
jgi:hypothetical protein